MEVSLGEIPGVEAGVGVREAVRERVGGGVPEGVGVPLGVIEGVLLPLAPGVRAGVPLPVPVGVLVVVAVPLGLRVLLWLGVRVCEGVREEEAPEEGERQPVRVMVLEAVGVEVGVRVGVDVAEALGGAPSPVSNNRGSLLPAALGVQESPPTCAKLAAGAPLQLGVVKAVTEKYEMVMPLALEIAGLLGPRGALPVLLTPGLRLPAPVPETPASVAFTLPQPATACRLDTRALRKLGGGGPAVTAVMLALGPVMIKTARRPAGGKSGAWGYAGACPLRRGEAYRTSCVDMLYTSTT